MLKKNFSISRDTTLQERAQILFVGNNIQLYEQAKIVVYNEEEPRGDHQSIWKPD